MIVAIHEAPKGFFETDPPHTTDELPGLVRKASSLGFQAIEIGPLGDYASIDNRRLPTLVEELNLKRSAHSAREWRLGSFRVCCEREEVLKVQAIEIVVAVATRSRMVSGVNSGIRGVVDIILKSMFWASTRESPFPVVRLVFEV